MRRITLVIISTFIVLALFVPLANTVMAEHTEFTFVGGVSFREDSKISLALVDGHYVYSPMYLTIGSSYDCNYTVYVNGTEYLAGQINVTQQAIYDFKVNFTHPGSQSFIVVVGFDNYTYQIDVLMQSYESVIVETVPPAPGAVYSFNDILKAYVSSIVGLLVALFLAYLFKVEKIRHEIREVI